jgi:hypothetical protein
MKKHHIFSIIGLAIIAIIVLVLVLPGKDAPSLSGENSSEITAVTLFEEPDIIPGEGGFVYSYEGIQWDFNLIEAGSARTPETKVGFFFDNFTRRESGVPASFARPFGIGYYQGECVALDSLSDTSVLEETAGALIAAAACVAEGTQDAALILITQDGLDVNVYNRRADGEVNLDRTIDISTIVK